MRRLESLDKLRIENADLRSGLGFLVLSDQTAQTS